MKNTNLTDKETELAFEAKAREERGEELTIEQQAALEKFNRINKELRDAGHFDFCGFCGKRLSGSMVFGNGTVLCGACHTVKQHITFTEYESAKETIKAAEENLEVPITLNSKFYTITPQAEERLLQSGFFFAYICEINHKGRKVITTIPVD